MKTTELGKSGESIPVVGQGTWGLSKLRPSRYHNQWKKVLHKGVELGMTHIDTAEAYGWGKAEEVVGEVVSKYSRDDLFITTKLFPIHFTYTGMKKAAQKSLKRLGLEYVDLYLVHWPNPLISVEKQMKVMEDLVKEGKTRYIGVSNFSVSKFKSAQNALKREELVTNQVRANVATQHHIKESLPYYQKTGITLTAYSPLGHRGFSTLKGSVREKLEQIAATHDATIQQIAIAWLVNLDNVITIPKTSQVDHVKANAAAGDIQLSSKEMDMLAAH